MPHFFVDGHTYDPCLKLFIDDHHVRNLFAVERKWGRPQRPAEPVLGDIDGRCLAWGCVRQDAGRFRLWYQSVLQANCHEIAEAGVWGRGDDFGYFPDRHPDACRETQTSVLSYAESDNGLDWHRPQLDLLEWQGSTANNIVMDGSAAAKQFDGAITNLDTVSVVIDEDAPGHERYKLFCHWETVHVWDNVVAKLGRSDACMERFWKPRGKYICVSGDGIHWQPELRFAKKPAGGGDYSGITRDHRHARWWCNDRAPVGLPDIGFRSAGLCTSDDLLHWPETVEQVIYPDAADDWSMRYQHHGMIPFTYGDQDLGYLELSLAGCPVANHLLTHREGRRWNKAGDRPLIEVGPTGSFDDTLVNAMRNPPLVVGDELIIPYNARTSGSIGFQHFTGQRQGHLALARLRLDGFAALTVNRDAVMRHRKPAYIQTQPIEVQADALHVNIAAHGGSARVALLDEAAQPIEGFTLDNCGPLAEDAVRAAVRWKGHADLRPLRGRAVMVLIELAAGSVWSVRL